jgi:hypothetical protein
VSSLDSGAEENVVKWCLVCHCMGQKSPVVVQHAQETAELRGGLGSLAALLMADLGCSEDAFRRVDGDPVPLKSVAQRPWMSFVLIERPGENENVVQSGGCVCSPLGGQNERGNCCR